MVMSSAREKARQRGDAFKARLIESTDWLSPEQAAEQLDCSVDELREQIKAGDLIAVDHDERVLIPAFQVSGGKLLPHLRETLHAMSIESPWLRLSWLIAPNERLCGESPLESLERAPEAVLLVAKGVGVQGGA